MSVNKAITSVEKAITPDQVAEKKREAIPDVIFEIFNELIVENYRENGSQAVFRQREVINRMRVKGINVDEAFEKGWLDVEPIYAAAGWKVEYDSPAFNESYPETFKFSKPRKED